MMPLLLLLVALCALLPAYLVIAGLPALWCVQTLLLAEKAVLFSAGPIDVAPLDVVLALLFAKLFFTVTWTRQWKMNGPLYLALGIFLLVNLLATLAAGVKFGELHLLRCLAAWLRLLSEMLLVPIAAHAIRTLPQARQCARVLLGTLVVLAAIQYVNFVGAGHGFTIGEVQGLERGEARYFGPVGDSIGVILLLGYLASLCFAHLPGALFFLGGILLTAGVGAMFAAAAGTFFFLLFALQSPAVRLFARRILWLMPLLLFTGVLVQTLFGAPLSQTLIDRLSSGRFTTSGSQRVDSGTIAVRIFTANPILGVGYLGYKIAFASYGGGEFFDLSKPDGGTANANNQFLQELADAGLLGLAAFALLIFTAARLFRRLARRDDDPLLHGLFLATFLWLLAQVFGNLAAVWLVPSSYSARLLWILLGLAVAVTKLLPATETAPAVFVDDSGRLVSI